MAEGRGRVCACANGLREVHHSSCLPQRGTHSSIGFVACQPVQPQQPTPPALQLWFREQRVSTIGVRRRRIDLTGLPVYGERAYFQPLPKLLGDVSLVLGILESNVEL